MKIKYDFIKRTPIEYFAKEHNLTLVMRERSDDELSHAWDHKFVCYFEYLEEKDGDKLVTYGGYGQKPSDAIHDYCRQISNAHLVYKAADKKNRKEIKTEIITPDWKEEKVK